jgi:hypothetical protein
MDKSYIAIGCGLLLFAIGLLSVWRPKLVWNLDLDQIQGENTELIKARIRSRWRVGSIVFLAAGATFIGLGLYQLLR